MRALITFLKNWTLPSAIVVGTVLYLVFAYVPALDGAARFFDPIFDAIFPLFMAMILSTVVLFRLAILIRVSPDTIL